MKIAYLVVALAYLLSTAGTGAVNAQASFTCSTVTEIPPGECEALVALYNSTNGPAWTNHTNWLENNTPSTWRGVILASGRVGILFLPNNNLSGIIPPELGNFTAMTELYLLGNHLSGSIPPQLSAMVNLRNLFLQNNQLTGSIPVGLGSMWRLFQIGLSDNQLSGTIPVEFRNLVNLRYLVLSNNHLTGSIPPELKELKLMLYSLYLAGNELTGSIPPELGELFNLGELDLSNNKLEGSIPASLGSLTSLEALRLNNNRLSGEVPASLVNLSNMVDPGSFFDGGDGLDLDYNRLTIPAEYPSSGDPTHVFLNTKDPNWHMRQAFNKVVDPDGGTLASLDNSVGLDIPPDALSDVTTFTFIPQPSPQNSPGSLVFARNSFQITAVDGVGNPVTTFAQPVSVTVHYDSSDLQNNAESTLGLYYWDTTGEKWVNAVTTCTAGAYTRDIVANNLSLPICHLTEFALLVENTPKVYLPAVLR